MGKKVLTSAEIAAKKNVNQGQITAIDGESIKVMQEPRGVVSKIQEGCYTWAVWHTVLGERKRLLYCELPFETRKEAARHCRQLLGMAWNLEVEGEE